MPNLSIKDVPEQVAEALRQRATRNHRSLQGELMAIVWQAAAESQLAAPHARSSTADHDARGKPILRRGSKTIEQIFGEHLARFPEPIQGVRAVDLIREDRDAR